MTPERDPLPRRRLLPLAATIGLILVMAAVLPLFGGREDTTPVTTTTTTTDPSALSDRPPFQRPLPGAIAYLGDDRVFRLLDLRTGESLGSRSVPGTRRPAAASPGRVYLGNLPATGGPDGNWDSWRSFPWQGTLYADHLRGVSVAYSPDLDTIAAAMRPLPGDPTGENGVVLDGPDGRTVATSTSGWWAFVTWVGDEVLVRELTGRETRWYLIPGSDPGRIETDGDHGVRRIWLPESFLPIAGTAGLAFGQMDGEAAIADVASGRVTPLDGPFSWAADWQPAREQPLVATVGGDPPALVAYTATGTTAWTAPLHEPVTRFGGGVAWSPDGEFVVVAAAGSFEAYTAAGERIGRFDPVLPDPQQQMAFVAVVPEP